ncbi:MAG: cytochrome P460 family protein [Terracidiphilus sp.]|jgi:hypothetical protein
MRKLAILALGAILAFGLLQFARPGIPTRRATAELQAPPEVRRILEKDCYSCHSDQRRLAWFDEVVPGYWLVRHDILTAREHLNFSTIGSKPLAVQRAALYEAVNMIQLGAMPLPSFKKLHPDANVTPEELTILKAYLAPWTTAPGQPSSPEAAMPISLNTVQPEFNGFPFDATFASWKPISTTDRGDNNTFRFILGNEIAVSAVRSGNITPWPDGARFAKIAWQQELGADGLIHPGKFVQVELMLKDARTYKDTEGWGWGRWKGLDLKPYGEDARFVGECTSCHLPVRGNDYVYTLPITTANVNGDEIVNNAAAALPFNLPYQALGWSAITIYVDPKTRTTATLYGNDIAMNTMQSLHSKPIVAGERPYGGGAVLALVTWAQRDAPHWFGGRIPQRFQIVEFVVVSADGTKTYSRYDAAGQPQDHAGRSIASQRTNFMLALAPAQLP